MDINKIAMDNTKDKKGYKNIYNSLNSEHYWLVWIDDNTNVFGFEYNSNSNIPDNEYTKLVDLLESLGFVYVYNLPEKNGKVKNR